MEQKVVRTTRKALYDEVWATPMARLKTKYGISDVGLAKICRKHNIPRPGRGYWAKKQHGDRPPVVSLSLPDQNPEIEIREHVPSMPCADGHEPTPPVPVPETLRSAHPIVHSTLQTLELCDVDELGIITPPPKKPCLNVRVSKTCLRRALRLMDGLIKALESRGRSVSLLAGSPGATVEISGQRVAFRMDEGLVARRVEKEVSDLQGPYQFHHSAYQHERVPSGQLRLSIEAQIWCDTRGLRNVWSDGQRLRLETQLAGVIDGMAVYAARQAERVAEEEESRRKEEVAERKRQEVRRLREDLAAKIKKEQARVDDLLRQVEDWHSACALREYITAVQAKARSDGKECGSGSEVAVWVNWATQQADRLDPFAVSPPSILDRAQEVTGTEAQAHDMWGLK